MTTVAYHFWSPTCQPCKVIKPSIEQLKEEFSGVQWISVNLHEDPHDYALKYKVTVEIPIIKNQIAEEFLLSLRSLNCLLMI